MENSWQAKKVMLLGPRGSMTQDLVIPNPKLKLLDQVLGPVEGSGSQVRLTVEG
jgi:hypothetical protein